MKPAPTSTDDHMHSNTSGNPLHLHDLENGYTLAESTFEHDNNTQEHFAHLSNIELIITIITFFIIIIASIYLTHF